jgi:hypothetical protein
MQSQCPKHTFIDLASMDLISHISEQIILLTFLEIPISSSTRIHRIGFSLG